MQYPYQRSYYCYSRAKGGKMAYVRVGLVLVQIIIVRFAFRVVMVIVVFLWLYDFSKEWTRQLHQLIPIAVLVLKVAWCPRLIPTQIHAPLARTVDRPAALVETPTVEPIAPKTELKITNYPKLIYTFADSAKIPLIKILSTCVLSK